MTIFIDCRYGAILSGISNTKFGNLGAYPIVNTPYIVLGQLFVSPIKPSDVLVEVGCGKGRVINWWLSKGVTNKIFGLEIDPDIGAATAHRLRKHKNVEILIGDACENLPPNGTIFYLYNPFDATTLKRFAERITDTSQNLRDVSILYYNPEHIDVFNQDHRWKAETLDYPLRKYYHSAALISATASLL